MIRVIIQGAAGRMGRMLVNQVLNDPELTLAAAIEIAASPFLGHDAGTVAGAKACGVAISADLDAALRNAGAVIDFSTPASTRQLAAKAAAHGVAHAIGTTGLGEDDKAQLRALADTGARIVFAPNMSVGVNVMFKVIASGLIHVHRQIVFHTTQRRRHQITVGHFDGNTLQAGNPKYFLLADKGKSFETFPSGRELCCG